MRNEQWVFELTESRVNSQLITHARMHAEMNLKSTTTKGSTFE